MQFQTKAEIALGLLDEAKVLNVPHACVTADADYGDNPSFLNGLEARKERYVAAVAQDFTVTLLRNGGHGEKAEALLRRAVPRGVCGRPLAGQKEAVRAVRRCERSSGSQVLAYRRRRHTTRGLAHESLRHSGAESDGGKRGLDHVRRSDVLSVRLAEVVAHDHSLPAVALQGRASDEHRCSALVGYTFPSAFKMPR